MEQSQRLLNKLQRMNGWMNGQVGVRHLFVPLMVFHFSISHLVIFVSVGLIVCGLDVSFGFFVWFVFRIAINKNDMQIVLHCYPPAILGAADSPP